MSDRDISDDWKARIAASTDSQRSKAVASRRDKGSRTARQNLLDLCDPGSFDEYGQLAVAAQRGRRDADDLRENTAADGVITGIATINADLFGADRCRTVVIVYDYTVLAGTQGYFHHRKLDRIIEQAQQQALPVVIFTEGGGGRPGDTDVTTQIAGLNLPTFARFAGLARRVPRIAVNHGYCFAGNAALFGSCDLRIATRASAIGMAGPAMIEAGGLGRFSPAEIGPAESQWRNGVIDVLVNDEAQATDRARQLLGFFQGALENWENPLQQNIAEILPADRRYAYHVRRVIETLADPSSFLEITAGYGAAVITGLLRIEGRPLGVLANDCRVLGGAIDAPAADKAARFMRLCSDHGIALLSLIDTPGFMVGPASEEQAAVRHMSELFNAGSQVAVPHVAVVLRKAYGLGAMAMAGGSLAQPRYCVSWPTGEFGAMGLEGAVTLGFRKELEAAPDASARESLYQSLLQDLYRKGKAVETAAHLEIDAVIDPAETRGVVSRALG